MIVMPAFAKPKEAHKVRVGRWNVPAKIDMIYVVELSSTDLRVEWTMTPKMANWINTPNEMQTEKVSEDIPVPCDIKWFAEAADQQDWDKEVEAQSQRNIMSKRFQLS